MAQVRPAAHHCRVAKARMDGESETGLPAAAGGQPAVCSQAEVHRHHGLQPRPEGRPLQYGRTTHINVITYDALH